MDERLLTRTKLNENGCLEWCGDTSSAGYGRIYIDNIRVYTHRYVWGMYNGRIKKGMCVCHRCDNRVCCNIEHLFLGTLADNVHDMLGKGRDRHPVGPENGRSKLNEDAVKEIRELSRSGTYSQRALAKRYQVSKNTVRAAIIGKTWKHLL